MTPMEKEYCTHDPFYDIHNNNCEFYFPEKQLHSITYAEILVYAIERLEQLVMLSKIVASKDDSNVFESQLRELQYTISDESRCDECQLVDTCFMDVENCIMCDT